MQRLAALWGRLVGRDGRIGALPSPFTRWSSTPATQLRRWWRRTRQDGGTTTEGEGR
ncbi:hypothetical protein ACWD4G_18200 [Streptomyces sp. NPDC002643]